MPKGVYARKPKVDVTKGVGSVLQPGATLAPVTTNLPDTGISVAAQLNQYNSLQPVQAFEMSVAARKAVTAITTQCARATLRIFTESGDEVIAGDAFDFFQRPAPNWSTKRFLEYNCSNRLITGEMAISLLLTLDGSRLLGAIPLAPNRLYPIDPTTPNELIDIKTWQYTLNNGMCVQYPAQSVIFAPNYNPSSHVRGLSNFITGVNAVSVSYQALRYMKDYYTNNAVPSHIIVLEKGLSKQQREDWEERYLEQYATYNNQSQKVIVSSGTALDVKKLDSEQKTGEQLNLLNYSDDQIAKLFSVPPTIMGNFDRVRFETASIERAMFLEDSILPLLSVMEEVLQHDIMDRFFASTSNIRGKSLKPIKKNLRDILDKRLNQKSYSGYYVVLDPNTIPLMTQIQIDKFNAVDTLTQKGHMSVNEACEYLSIEIPYNPVRDKIYVNSGVQELTLTQPDEGVLPLRDETNLEVEALEHSNDKQKRTQAETSEDEKLEETKVVKALHNKYRQIRKQVLINNDSDKVYTLAEMDTLCKDLYLKCPALRKEIRKDLFVLKKSLKTKTKEERPDAIREFYNQKKPSVLRKIMIHQGYSEADGVFLPNPTCCDICKALAGRKCKMDDNIEEISHINCRCSIVRDQ